MSNLMNKTVKELIDLCKSKSISGYSSKKKAKIIGEYNLFENEWIEQLKKVIYGY